MCLIGQRLNSSQEVTHYHQLKEITNYRLLTKLREGNVFRDVCQSFCSQGGRVSQVPGPFQKEGIGERGAWVSGGIYPTPIPMDITFFLIDLKS